MGWLASNAIWTFERPRTGYNGGADRWDRVGMQIESIRQVQIGYPRLRPVGIWFGVIALLGMVLGAALFSLPAAIGYDFGARSFRFPGLYPPEHNAQFS